MDNVHSFRDSHRLKHSASPNRMFTALMDQAHVCIRKGSFFVGHIRIGSLFERRIIEICSLCVGHIRIDSVFSGHTKIRFSILDTNSNYQERIVAF